MEKNWRWTIVLIDGDTYHINQPLTIYELLNQFVRDGYNEETILALIRH